jgi:hypothetical protein
MPGRHRTDTKEGATKVLKFEQKAWGGGQNSDLPASTIRPDEVPLLQDIVAFREYVEGHSGSKKFSNTTAPETTCYACKFHKTAQKWCFVGDGIYIAGPTMVSWTPVSYESTDVSPTIAGDASGQLSGIALKGINPSNSNAGDWYWELTNTGDPVTGVRTFNIYKDLAHTQLVGRATRAGNGFCNILAQNDSGLHGWLTITYTTNDTDAANILSAGFDLVAGLYAGGGQGTLREYHLGFLFFSDSSVAPSVFYIDPARAIAWGVNPTGPNDPIIGSGTEGGGTPHGYRMLYTLSRIEGAGGAPDFTKNRVSGNLAWEGVANSTRGGSSPTNITKDYAEFWVANEISGSNPLQFYPTYDGLVNGTLLQYNADRVATHISIYRSLNIGAAGVDPVTGLGNSRDIFVWDSDHPIGTSQISLTKTDDDLRASFMAGYHLKTRFWAPLPAATNVGEVTPNFIYAAVRKDSKVQYSQTLNKEHVGSYHPSHQVIRLDDGLQVIAKSPDLVSFICAGRSWSSSPNVYKDVSISNDGLRRGAAAVYQLRHLVPSSTTVGVTDWSSFTEIREGLFVAHCADHTVRQWTGLSWGPDMADRKVRNMVRKMPIGSALGFVGDALLLWHRQDSGQTFNNKCLRYGFGGDAGEGWSTLARSSWIFPPLYAGAARYQDSNGVERLLVLNASDSCFYWVETFDGPDSSGLSKVWLDRVAVDGSGGTEITSTLHLRERTASQEDLTLTHQETRLSFRPITKAAGYRGALQVNISGYVEDEVAVRETITNVPKEGAISFAKEHQGLRLQTVLSFTASAWRLIKAYSRDLEDDRKPLGQGYAETNEGVYQRELSVNIKHWRTRSGLRLNRARGSLYTLTGSAPSWATGPDGKSNALSFTAGAYSQADTTSYTTFAISFWLKGVATGNRILALAGTAFEVVLNSNTQLAIGGQTIAINSVAAGWHHFALVRSGTTISVYQNGILLGTVTVAGAVGGTTATWNPDQAAMQLDDWRIQTSVVSAAAWAWYYDNVVNDAGSKVMP